MLVAIFLLVFGFLAIFWTLIFFEWAFKSMMRSYGLLIYIIVFIFAVTWIHTAFFNS